jgi:hypothetical protein
MWNLLTTKRNHYTVKAHFSLNGTGSWASPQSRYKCTDEEKIVFLPGIELLVFVREVYNLLL